jgi:tungstate transport system substrate-binding protein
MRYHRSSRLSLAAAVLLAACGGSGGAGGGTPVRVASTTSLYDTGLLDELVPAFHATHPGYDVQVVAVGTGEALALGQRKDADLVIVHAPEREEAFLADGYGTRRTTFMQNDFVLAGPEYDPAGIAGATGAADAMRRIAAAGADFASRGDDSGTHIRERMLWKLGGIEPEGDWYLDVGQGMGATLLFAGERQAYVLTDRATLTTMRTGGLDLVELYTGDEAMRNVYSVIPVTNAVEPGGAAAFESWILGPEAADIIRDYGVAEYGRALFTLLPHEMPGT